MCRDGTQAEDLRKINIGNFSRAGAEASAHFRIDIYPNGVYIVIRSDTHGGYLSMGVNN